MIVWTDYMRYRARLRGFDLGEIETIIHFSAERYIDSASSRNLVVGRHRGELVLIPFEVEGDSIQPITVHHTSRQQINSRIRSGRYTHV